MHNRCDVRAAGWWLALIAALTPLGVFATPACADRAWFQGLGFLPGGDASSAAGVSSNGIVVAASADCGQCNQAIRWTRGSALLASGFGPVPTNLTIGAQAISGDGSTIVGYSGAVGSIRWTLAHGVQLLPMTSTYGLSYDGSVIVGSTNTTCGFSAYRWTALGGPVCLGTLYPVGSTGESEARGVSADGLTIVGYSSLPVPVQGQVVAFRWTPATLMTSLGYLPGGAGRSVAHAVSADGQVIVGESNSANGIEAFRWTQGGGMQGLGDLPGEPFNSRAYSASADGSVIVGTGNHGFPSEAFVWTQTHGMRNLRAVLVSEYGLDLTGWRLTRAVGVSADGKTIVGDGFNPCGADEAWAVYLGTGAPCRADTDANGVVAVGDIFAFLRAWFGGDPRGDFNGMNCVTVADIFDFLTAWFAGCP